MKVMLFVPEYPPYNIGGGGVVYENIAIALAKFGIDVVVVWGYYPSTTLLDSSDRYKKNGITFYRIPEIPYIQALPYLRTAMPPNLLGIFSTISILKKEKPDIIHFHGYGLPFIAFGSLLSIIGNIPYVFTIHGFPKSPENNFLFHLFWNLYQKTLMNIVLGKSQAITCISKWLSNDKRLERFKEKIKIIYNGINIDSYKVSPPPNERDKLQKKLSIPNNANIILSVGRISRMKGFHLVIDILPRLNKEITDCYYIIIGEDDGYKETLKLLSKRLGVDDKVIFTGFISEKQKLDYIRQSDVYIVPSLWEPFGLTALEGLALEKVVVTTGSGGLKEFLDKSHNVEFFNQNSPDSLYHEIITILNGKKKYKKDNYIHNFEWDQVVNEYIQVYKESIGVR